MFELRETLQFSQWLERLRDREARARIQVRLQRLRLGLFGDVKPVGDGVSELCASITDRATGCITYARARN